MRGCAQELCGNWSGEGDVCPCAVFGIDFPDRPVHLDCGCVGVCEGHEDDEV